MSNIKLGQSILIPKDALSFQQEQSLKEMCSGSNPEHSSWRKMLAVYPWMARNPKKFPEPDKEIILYQEIEVDKKIYLEIPRGCYAFVSAAIGLIEDTTEEIPAEFVPGFKLRDYQEEAVNEVCKHKFGYLTATTGSGKTIMGFAIAAKLKQKTLFLVHKKSLLYQAYNQVKEMLGIEPGIVGDGKEIYKDFTICMVQSLYKKTPKEKFGIIIADEVHHFPSKVFSRVIAKIPANRVYGLSATPERPDGLSWILNSIVGPELYRLERKEMEQKKAVVPVKVIEVSTPYKPSKSFDPFQLAQHYNELCSCDQRNSFLVNYISKIVADNPDASIVVMTKRINHVDLLQEELKMLDPVTYHGKIPKKIKDSNLLKIKSGQTQLTITTYDSLGEGFDAPLWDTLILATPIASPIVLVQVIGRVSRPAKGKDKCYVHDLVDVNDEVLYNKFLKRKKVYNQL